MDPAGTGSTVSGSTSRQKAISSQDILLGQHDQLLHSLLESNQAMATQIKQLTNQLATLTEQFTQVASGCKPGQAVPADPPLQPSPSAPHLTKSHVPHPKHYRGDLRKCKEFLLDCSLTFNLNPLTYATDESKISYVMGLLRGKALAWASAAMDHQPVLKTSYANFSSEMSKVFDHPVQGREATQNLFSVRQGSRSVAEYSVDFRILAAKSGWNDEALQYVFLNGLRDQIQDKLVTKDYSDLDALILLAIRLDNRLRECESMSVKHPPLTRTRPAPTTWPQVTTDSTSGGATRIDGRSSRLSSQISPGNKGR